MSLCKEFCNPLEMIAQVAAERERIIARDTPNYVLALTAARTHVGSAIESARQYGAPGFVLVYHSQTRQAEQYLKRHLR